MRSPEDIRPDKVAIYIRWSTEDQSDGTTLAVQRDGCQHYVLSQGWRVSPSLIFVDDGYSGGSLDRPAMTALRQAVRDGEVDCVVVYKLDRLSRSVMDTVNLVLDEWDSRTYLKSAREPVDTTTPMGKQFFYMLVSYAEWERSVIRERTYSGKVRRAKEGKYWGGTVPLGYRLSGQSGILEIDPDQAQIVRRIFSSYLQEMGAYSIAYEFNRDGIPSPTGGTWSDVTVRIILKNPIYAGQIQYGKRMNNPRHHRDKSESWYTKPAFAPIQAESQSPAIITLEEFERVQMLMESRQPKKTGVRALSSEHLLTGILRCPCGSAMVSHVSVPKGGQAAYHYYSCRTKDSKGRGTCSSGVIREEHLDAHVEEQLKTFLQGEESYSEFVAMRWSGVEAELAQTRDRQNKVDAALAKLTDQTKRINKDYRDGTLSATLYEENRREIDEETSRLKAQQVELGRLERSLLAELEGRSGLRQWFDLAKRWDDLTIPERKVVLRNFVSRMVAFRAPRAKNFKVEITWRFEDPGSIGSTPTTTADSSPDV